MSKIPQKYHTTGDTTGASLAALTLQLGAINSDSTDFVGAATSSLKEYRKSIEIRSKIIARRQGHPCYFDMIVRRDNSSNFRDDVVAVASRLTLRELCKINSRERAMLEMFDEFADDVSETEDAETYDETFDAEFSKCRAERKKLATRRETII